MRKMFSKFFGKKSKNVEIAPSIIQANEIDRSLVDKPVDKDLFVDEEVPSASAAEIKKLISVVNEFLQLDHYSLGQEEGYDQHSAEYMRKRINSMASTFRRLLYEEMEEYRSKITELKMHLAQIGEQFPEVKQQLVLRIEEHSAKIDLYLREAQNSVELDGLIGSPVKEYEAGYEVGLKFYLAEKGFLNSFTL